MTGSEHTLGATEAGTRNPAQLAGWRRPPEAEWEQSPEHKGLPNSSDCSINKTGVQATLLLAEEW